jgi:hypothetical protein
MSKGTGARVQNEKSGIVWGEELCLERLGLSMIPGVETERLNLVKHGRERPSFQMRRRRATNWRGNEASPLRLSFKERTPYEQDPES